MSLDSESGRQDKFSFEGSVTHAIPSERDVVNYSVSDHELDSLETFTTSTTVFVSLALLFLSVAAAGFLDRLDKSWLYVITVASVGIIFCGLAWFSFRKKSSTISRIRTESRPRLPS